MVHSILRWPLLLGPAALFVAVQAAPAQPAAPAARPDPLDPAASVPALAYASSFARYRRLGDDKPIAWRDANDAVARIGGWRVYARESQQPDAAPPAVAPAASAPAATPLPLPAPAGHGGHHAP